MPQVRPVSDTSSVPTSPVPAVEFLRLDSRAKAPFRHFESDVGWDLFAFTYMGENPNPSKIMIPSRGVRAIPTRIAIRPPLGFFTMVCSRSGLAKDRVLFVANSPGIIDPEYTGEILVLLYNGGYEPYWINHEDRVAQIVILKSPQLAFREVRSLAETQRGARGFGSTGR